MCVILLNVINRCKWQTIPLCLPFTELRGLHNVTNGQRTSEPSVSASDTLQRDRKRITIEERDWNGNSK